MQMPLTKRAQAILRELVSHIESSRIDPESPQTFVGYKAMHDTLNLNLQRESYGDSLTVQGLSDLAEWTLERRLPAITGLVVDQTTYLPGSGYFDLFGRDKYDFQWWIKQVRESIEFNWRQFLTEVEDRKLEATPRALDFTPPERIQTVEYRILRDTELSLRVKRVHNYCCQLCGHYIEFPDRRRYAEGHHIQPLGGSHAGPDVIQNIICVCPNHHAELDLGIIQLSLSNIRLAIGHEIGQSFIDYHNTKIFFNTIAT